MAMNPASLEVILCCGLGGATAADQAPHTQGQRLGGGAWILSAPAVPERFDPDGVLVTGFGASFIGGVVPSTAMPTTDTIFFDAEAWTTGTTSFPPSGTLRALYDLNDVFSFVAFDDAALQFDFAAWPGYLGAAPDARGKPVFVLLEDAVLVIGGEP
jgi:hypothetical protein